MPFSKNWLTDGDRSQLFGKIRPNPTDRQWRSHEPGCHWGPAFLEGPQVIGAPPYHWIVHAYILGTVCT